MEISFDPDKRLKALHERGLDFARASEVFDALHITIADDRRDYGENRFITVGFLDRRMVVLVWTERDETIRVISMRKANEREQAIYGTRLVGN